jgi:precorrin-6Y C5,15-methyltransferase (decarboxylating)
MMQPIQVVGVGLEGPAGLGASVRALIGQAGLLVGSERLLQFFPELAACHCPLAELGAIASIIGDFQREHPEQGVVVLASGDPLFFGVGRLLLQAFAPEALAFHPTVSSMQLAFSRIRVPWQDATLVSAHGRSLDELQRVLQAGCAKIAVLSDRRHTPGAIAELLLGLALPVQYVLWVCENLGGEQERVRCFEPEGLLGLDEVFADLTVTVLMQREHEVGLSLEKLPRFGIPDDYFQGFVDRPGLMTKREVRVLALGELALGDGGCLWDIGAGTGSMSIELARLVPEGKVFAVERAAAGVGLIERNAARFGVSNVRVVAGAAPDCLRTLPTPDRVFIGGSGQQLTGILDCCGERLAADGVVVLAIATLENLQEALGWLQAHDWSVRVLQTQLARSVPVAALTRFMPLNPVYLVTGQRR